MIDDQKAIETLKNTEKQGETTASKLGDIAKKGVMVGTAVAAGVATAAGALVGMVTKTSETADRIDKLSAKTGLSKQAFQEWDYVLGQNGIEIEKMQTGMKTLTANMDAAAAGNENMAGAFDSLGVSVTNADGSLRGQEETMNDVILKLADMPNGIQLPMPSRIAVPQESSEVNRNIPGGRGLRCIIPNQHGNAVSVAKRHRLHAVIAAGDG